MITDFENWVAVIKVHFSDGRNGIIKICHDDVDAAWPYNEFVWEDGSVTEFPQGCEWSINPLPTDS
jgi:hypothetical protein